MADVALRIGVLLFLHGTVVLAVAGLVVRKGGLPAASRHAVWTTAFAVLLLLPLGTALVPGWRLDLRVDSSSRSRSAPTTTRALPRQSSAAPDEPIEPEASESSAGAEAPLPVSSSSPGLSRWVPSYQRAARWIGPAFVLLWAGGVLLLLGRLALGMGRLWRWKQTAADADCTALADALARQMEVRRFFAVRYSPEIRVPLVWGLPSPVLLLPEEAADWSQDRLKTVLLHELAHVKRWDGLTHVLSRVARACFWPNPLVWKAAAAATAAQEEACDNAVLRSGVASWAYADHLLTLTKTLRRARSQMEVVSLDSGLRFKSRMRALLTPTTPRRALRPWERGLLFVSGAVLLVATSVVQIGSSLSPAERGPQARIEAEQTALHSTFVPRTDGAASGEGYVRVAEDGDRDDPPDSPSVTYSFDTDAAGTHVIWARVRVPDGSHNSFWIRVDSTRWIQWNGIEEGEQWHWVQVRDFDQGGRPVAFDLSEGMHRLHLGPREDEVDVDQFVVTGDWTYRPQGTENRASPPPRAHRIWLEAEDGWLEPPLRLENAPDASGWQYLAAPSGESSIDSPPATGHATFSFTVPASGTYRLWGRAIAPSGSSNSFWLRVDEGPWIRWNGIQEGARWHWEQVHDSDDDNTPVRLDLSAGEHQLTVAYRERDAKLDRLLLASRATYLPRGTGERVDASTPVSRALAIEDADLTPPMVRRTDTASTSSTSWIEVPDGPGNDAPEGGPGAATWTVSVPEAGHYVLWGEVEAPATNDNSFYVSVDGGEEKAWHTPAPEETTDGWTWDPVSDFDAGEHTDPVLFSLEKGRHRIRVRNREDGTRLRRLLLTNVSTAEPATVRP